MTASDLKMINVCWQKLTYSLTHSCISERFSETQKTGHFTIVPPGYKPSRKENDNNNHTHIHTRRWFMVFQMYITIIRHINEKTITGSWQSMSQVKLWISYAFKSLVNEIQNWFYISVWLLASFWLVPKRITKTTKDQKEAEKKYLTQYGIGIRICKETFQHSHTISG